MRHLQKFLEFVLYEAPQDDENHKERPALDANLDRVDEARGLSPDAFRILAAMVQLSNDANCWAVMDMDCPLFSGWANARRELIDKQLVVVQPHGVSQFLYLRSSLKRRLVSEMDLVVEPTSEAVLKCPTPVAG
jgi:hypothetical protein